MINFFRKIRKELADDNKPVKYFRYAVGEILLVVIGILIALSVNNWNEDRKERIIENDFLSRLHLDLQKDTIYINERIRNIEYQLESMMKYVRLMYNEQQTNSDFVNLTSLGKWSTEELILQDNTFSEITSSGKFGIIRNKKIKESIIDYYKVYSFASTNISELNRTGLDIFIEIFPMLAKYFKDTLFDKSMYNESDWEFINDPTSITFRRLESAASHYSYKYKASLEHHNNLLQKATILLELIEETQTGKK